MYKFIIISFISLFGAVKPGSGQTHEQTATLYQTTTAKNISKAFSTASSSGNLVIVHIDWDGQTRSISSVTDNKGNSYARISGPTNWNGTSYRAELWYAYNITGGGAAINVTAHLSGAPTSFSQIYISEYSGIIAVDPLDNNSVAAGSTAAVSTGSKNIGYTNELIYGVSIGASGVLTKGTGFTSRSGTNSNIVEDKKAASTGAYNATFTSAGGNWIAQMATFITTSSSITLPVELLSFTGQCNNDNIELAWTTASEENNDYFSIERSDDASNWQPVGTVRSAGDASAPQRYSFSVNQTTADKSYFRLKQTDKDGRFKFFDIIEVDNCKKDLNEIRIYPNPTNGITLSGRVNSIHNEEYAILVFDNLGRMLGRYASTQPEFTIYFSHTLPEGVYYARISSANFSKSTCFLVKH